MKSNAVKMQAAVDFVTANPGLSYRVLMAHLFETEIAQRAIALDEERRGRVYKKAAGVVDRVLRDRLVRQDAALCLHPWDAKEKAFAEALERAAFAAPDPERFSSTLALACAAWRKAGDPRRAMTLAGCPSPFTKKN